MPLDPVPRDSTVTVATMSPRLWVSFLFLEIEVVIIFYVINELLFP